MEDMEDQLRAYQQALLDRTILAEQIKVATGRPATYAELGPLPSPPVAVVETSDQFVPDLVMRHVGLTRVAREKVCRKSLGLVGVCRVKRNSIGGYRWRSYYHDSEGQQVQKYFDNPMDAAKWRNDMVDKHKGGYNDLKCDLKLLAKNLRAKVPELATEITEDSR